MHRSSVANAHSEVSIFDALELCRQHGSAWTFEPVPFGYTQWPYFHMMSVRKYTQWYLQGSDPLSLLFFLPDSLRRLQRGSVCNLYSHLVSAGLNRYRKRNTISKLIGARKLFHLF